MREPKNGKGYKKHTNPFRRMQMPIEQIPIFNRVIKNQ
jgi:hypothetical protein